MIYTVGDKQSYTEAFEEKRALGQTLLKKGRTPDYSGGIIFRFPLDAFVYLLDKDHRSYTVYGVQAVWVWIRIPTLRVTDGTISSGTPH